MLLEKVQRNFEPRADCLGGGLCCPQRITPIATVETNLDAEMGGRERRDQLPLTRVERVGVPVLPQPEGRHAGADRLAE